MRARNSSSMPTSRGPGIARRSRPRAGGRARAPPGRSRTRRSAAISLIACVEAHHGVELEARKARLADGELRSRESAARRRSRPASRAGRRASGSRRAKPGGSGSSQGATPRLRAHRLPERVVLARVGVDRLRQAAVHRRVGLLVALQAERAHLDAGRRRRACRSPLSTVRPPIASGSRERTLTLSSRPPLLMAVEFDADKRYLLGFGVRMSATATARRGRAPHSRLAPGRRRPSTATALKVAIDWPGRARAEAAHRAARHQGPQPLAAAPPRAAAPARPPRRRLRARARAAPCPRAGCWRWWPAPPAAARRRAPGCAAARARRSAPRAAAR